MSLSHTYMFAQFKNKCGVIPSLLQIYLKHMLKKEQGLFCVELYVNVIEILDSFSQDFPTA